MKIDSGSLAFNININGKVGGTPSWGTAIVYQTDDNKIKEDIAKDILIGMIYKKIDCTSKELSLPLGKGGKIYHGDEDFNTNGAPSVPYLAAKFENTYVNGKFVGKPFILLVMKDGYDAHNGRLQLKYSPKIAWGQYRNQEFFDEVFNILGIPSSAPLIYYSIDVLDQDKLHFRCIFKEDEYTFIDAKEYNDFLKQTINVDEQVEIVLNKTYNDNLSIQQIFYGCPGSGKSHEVRKKTNTAHNEGFAGLSSIERQQTYQKYLDDKNGHKKNYKGGKVNIIALTHPKLMSYIALCSEYEINSLFEISNEEDFNAIIEALKGCEAYKNDSITKGSGCHWETGLKSYGEFLKDQIPNTEPRKDAVFRTTFHPDTDYATFVGCYKPCMNGGIIEYSYMPQVFTNAYIAAWENTKKPVYLVIEEINRGNCAQIFGDLFQLLDRDKVTGKSEYPIKADKDLVAHIEKVLGAGHEGIKNGELCLPPNLIIYATMNTSDQSLFPMDSAFKRRWDWEYVPINYSKDIDSGKFIIEIDEDTKYSWVEFLESVNDKIYDATNSEDKQMGNFFIKKSIKANEFVNKVMFYLWNEVCKEEYGTQRNFFRKGKEGKTEFKFTELFGDNQATILKEFMTSLGVEPIGKKPEEPISE